MKAKKGKKHEIDFKMIKINKRNWNDSFPICKQYPITIPSKNYLFLAYLISLYKNLNFTLKLIKTKKEEEEGEESNHWTSDKFIKLTNCARQLSESE